MPMDISSSDDAMDVDSDGGNPPGASYYSILHYYVHHPCFRFAGLQPPVKKRSSCG